MGLGFAKVSQIFKTFLLSKEGLPEGLLLVLRMQYAARSWQSALPVHRQREKEPFSSPVTCHPCFQP